MLIKLLKKEMKLSSSKLTFLFILFGLLAFCPGYPILLSGFFVCLGIFQSFQSFRENNDILYSALLPVSKADTVKGKYLFCVFIELCAFALSFFATVLRMTVLSEAGVYRNNALMNANFVFLGFLLVIFGCFNLIFVRGFFKTGYYFLKPFVGFIAAAFTVTGIAESLHHIPGLEKVNAFGFEHIGLQLLSFFTGIAVYAAFTVVSVRSAVKLFEKTDIH